MSHLPDITQLSVNQPRKNWDLTKFEQFSYSREITAKANERIDIPYLDMTSTMLVRDDVSLFETRATYFFRDCFDALKLQVNDYYSFYFYNIFS